MSTTTITKALDAFVTSEARKRGVEEYRILQRRSITEIANKKPETKSDLKDVYGIGEKKADRYGSKILSIVKKGGSAESEEEEEDVLSVGELVRKANESLRSLDARVRGEITEVSISNSGNVYLSLKDAEAGVVLNCFVSQHVYELGDVELREGMEIICDGYPSVYEPRGSFRLQVQAIEPAGEGALRAQYEKLKKELTEEGVFAEEKKRDLPTLPESIGVITSRTGAVIDDIWENLGPFGFDVQLYDARVEGKRALEELLEAMEYFAGTDVDIIVIGRGGGSLEALQAFNSEALVRAVANSPVPVIASIGHEKDVPLVAMAADKSVSTPSMAAVEIRSSWEATRQWLDEQAGRQIKTTFKKKLKTVQQKIDRHTLTLKSQLNQVAGYFETLENRFIRAAESTKSRALRSFRDLKKRFYRAVRLTEKQKELQKKDLNTQTDRMIQVFDRLMSDLKENIKSREKELTVNDPSRLLSRGYSIVKSGDEVVRTTEDVSAGDITDIRVTDGTITSEVKNTNQKKD